MNDDLSTRYNSREPSLTPVNTIDDIGAADLLLEMLRREQENLATKLEDGDDSDFYDDGADIYLDAESPREAWELHKPAENKILTARCSNKDPQCPHTILSTKIHYHCPEEKCLLSKLSPQDEGTPLIMSIVSPASARTPRARANATSSTLASQPSRIIDAASGTRKIQRASRGEQGGVMRRGRWRRR